MKVKVWCLCKSQQAFKGCSLFLWVLRHGTVWHLAFPQASNGDSVCCLCPWNTLFICSCLSYASLPFTKLLLSQGNDGKLTYLHWCQMLFWLCGVCGLNTNTHTHVPTDQQTTPKVCLLPASDTKVPVVAYGKTVYFLSLWKLAVKFYLSFTA